MSSNTDEINSEVLSTIIHDMNSGLSSLSQAIEIVKENIDSDPELCKQLLNLMHDKSHKVMDTWNSAKGLLQKH
ncbi:MAG: hypothetical protein ACPGJV_02805 [Bacteriovoracaceae bacterium]